MQCNSFVFSGNPATACIKSPLRLRRLVQTCTREASRGGANKDNLQAPFNLRSWAPRTSICFRIWSISLVGVKGRLSLLEICVLFFFPGTTRQRNKSQTLLFRAHKEFRRGLLGICRACPRTGSWRITFGLAKDMPRKSNSSVNPFCE